MVTLPVKYAAKKPSFSVVSAVLLFIAAENTSSRTGNRVIKAYAKGEKFKKRTTPKKKYSSYEKATMKTSVISFFLSVC